MFSFALLRGSIITNQWKASFALSLSIWIVEHLLPNISTHSNYQTYLLIYPIYLFYLFTYLLILMRYNHDNVV